MENKETLKQLHTHYNNITKLIKEDRCLNSDYMKGKADGVLIAIEMLKNLDAPLF